MARPAGPPRLLLAAAGLSVAGLVLVLWAALGPETPDSMALYLGAALFVVSAFLQWRSRA